MTWQELADLINEIPGYQYLTISPILEDENGVQVSKYHYYQRGSIHRAHFHENLFSLILDWDAIFEPFLNHWVWLHPPKKDSSSSDALYFDISHGGILVEERKYGKVFFIHNNIWHGNMVRYDANPVTQEAFTQIGPSITQIINGTWIIPPGKNFTHLNTQDVKDPSGVFSN